MPYRMSQSLSCVLVPVVFSTKDRAPLLDSSIRPALYGYLASVARNSCCACFRAGGFADYAHLAVGISSTLTLAQLVVQLKSSSSKWLKTRSSAWTGLAWQEGYGAFSVVPASLEAWKRCIDAQDEQHQTAPFSESIESFLCDMGSHTLNDMFGVEAIDRAFSPDLTLQPLPRPLDRPPARSVSLGCDSVAPSVLRPAANRSRFGQMFVASFLT